VVNHRQGSIPDQSITAKSIIEGYRFTVGGCNVQLQSSIPAVIEHLQFFYPAYEQPGKDAYTDFYIKVRKPGNLRNWIQPQVVFELDNFLPFKPLPLSQAAAHLEWGLNWCIASQSHQYLIVHCAVVGKGPVGLLLPGAPGSGKSTLCAGLVANGWRLLSDEMALIRLDDLTVQPAPRPISLKNRSIEVMQAYFPAEAFGAVIPQTVKGRLTHLRAPASAIRQQHDRIAVTHVIFPRYTAAAATEMKDKDKAIACMKLIENSFNFNILGSEGFAACTDVIDAVDCYDLQYSDLDHAIGVIGDRLGVK
jgi:HprK-related kinase A